MHHELDQIKAQLAESLAERSKVADSLAREISRTEELQAALNNNASVVAEKV